MARDGSAVPANALGTYVRQRCGDIGMTLSELAAKLGVSRATVHRMISASGTHRLERGRLHDLATVLEVDPAVLSALWDGKLYDVGGNGHHRESIWQGFVLATKDLSDDELAEVVNVARAAVALARASRR